MERLEDVETMTLSEFHYKRYAQEYKEVDEEYRMHKIAFLTRNASATKNTGTEKKPKEEYVFKEFKDFFDYEKLIHEIDGKGQPKETVKTDEEKHTLTPAQIAVQHNSRKG